MKKELNIKFPIGIGGKKDQNEASKRTQKECDP